jgi:uncharacterized Fe-S cluster-containing radical SAM superfamily protein
MNCFNHPEKTIVATCQDCGKGLCTNCASKYEIPICVNCNAARISNEDIIIKKEIRQVFIIAIIITSLITYSLINNHTRFGFEINFDTKIVTRKQICIKISNHNCVINGKY